MHQPFIIVIPVYQGVTQLDFTGPYQFFCRLPNVKIRVASCGGQPVTVEGFSFADLSPLEEITRCDLLCVPGGNCTNAIENRGFVAAVKRLGQDAKYVTSVCTGSLILAAAGLLKGKRAACHWAWREKLTLFGATPDMGRVVQDGNIITGGGVTAGIDFALVVITQVAGEDLAHEIQLGLEYAPEPPFNSGRPESAPAAIRDKVTQKFCQHVAEVSPILERAARELSAH